MSRRRRDTAVERDQAATPFGGTLMRLVDSTAAFGAALVDSEGETVDYAGAVLPYDIRIAAAEWALVLKTIKLSRVEDWTDTHEVRIRARGKSFAVLGLPEGYAVVLELTPRCFSLSPRAVTEAVRELCEEAGLELPRWLRPHENWSRVEVRPLPNDPRRPAAVWVGHAWTRVELLGKYQAAHLEHGEIGYRARLASGAEITLVREQLGRWYAEDLPEH
jgi:hypothetical protein